MGSSPTTMSSNTTSLSSDTTSTSSITTTIKSPVPSTNPETSADRITPLSINDCIAFHLLPTEAPFPEANCPICSKEWEPENNDIVTTAKCNHVFHKECLVTLFDTISSTNRNTCPSCRTGLFVKDEDQGDIELSARLLRFSQRMDAFFARVAPSAPGQHHTMNSETRAITEEFFDAA